MCFIVAISCHIMANAHLRLVVCLSKKFFTGWIVVLITWIFFSAFLVVACPLWEGREVIYITMRGVYWDSTGQAYKLQEWQNSNPEKLHSVNSQISSHVLNFNQIHVVDGKTVDDGYRTSRQIDQRHI